MARKKSALSRALDLKPKLFWLFKTATTQWPASRAWLHCYPDIEDVRMSGGLALLDDSYKIRLSDPCHAQALQALAVSNWDVHRDNIILRDPLVTTRGIWMVPDLLVTGHTLAAVNPRTFRQVGVGRNAELNWYAARPWLLPARQVPVKGPAVVIPAIWNMWHLLIEFLIPLAKAAELRVWGDHELQVLTRARRPPVIDALVSGLCATLGVKMRIVPVAAHEMIQAEQLLIADSVCWNVERSFGFPETIGVVHAALRYAYADKWPAQAPAKRLYLTRGASKLRQITNEIEVIGLVRKLGFEVLEAKWDQHPAQIAAFSNASHIVGVHGAGLTNILFAKPGTRVFEMFPNDHRKTSMLHLCAEMGLWHEPFFGSDEGHNQAFSVDMESLEQALTAFVEAPAS